MRIMGLDYGSKTVGVAISDELMITAQGIETVVRKDENKLRRTLARLEELARSYEIEKIVLGYPKHMNNTLGDRAEKTENFKAMLERRLEVPVILWDERLTTVQANRALAEGGILASQRKQHLDRLAAVLILQNYLDSV